MDYIYIVCKPCEVAFRQDLDGDSTSDQKDRATFLGAHGTHVIVQCAEHQWQTEFQQTVKLVEIPSDTADELQIDDLNRRAARVKAEVLAMQEDMLDRPGWDSYFIGIARAVAARGSCSRLQVGAVLVLGHKIIATGYNGAPAGINHCRHYVKSEASPDSDYVAGDINDVKNGHCIVAEHAERNALLSCDVPKTGSTLYVTAPPCLACTRNAITSGVKGIVYIEQGGYEIDPEVDELCATAHITLTNPEA